MLWIAVAERIATNVSRNDAASNVSKDLLPCADFALRSATFPVDLPLGGTEKRDMSAPLSEPEHRSAMRLSDPLTGSRRPMEAG